MPRPALAALERALKIAGRPAPTRVTAQAAGLARVELAELAMTVLLGTVLAGERTLRGFEEETRRRGQRLLVVATNRRQDLPLELPIVRWERDSDALEDGYGPEFRTRGFHCKSVEIAELLCAVAEDRFVFASQIPARPVHCTIDLYTKRCGGCLAWTLVWCAEETAITDCRLITTLRSDRHDLWATNRLGVSPAVYRAVTAHLRNVGWAGTLPVIALRHLHDPAGLHMSFCCGDCGELLDSAYVCRNTQRGLMSFETLEITVGVTDAQPCLHWCYVERGRRNCAP